MAYNDTIIRTQLSKNCVSLGIRKRANKRFFAKFVFLFDQGKIEKFAQK